MRIAIRNLAVSFFFVCVMPVVPLQAQTQVASPKVPAAAGSSAGGLMQSVVARVHKKFINSDQDHDGFLTEQEAKRGHMSFTVRHFQRIDTRHTGHVSERQIENYMIRRMTGHGNGVGA
ncbi:hypothetical protein [Oleiagrimonas sp. C23AA]|uniref:hypothetical protein n=1 Tax=Oleiagrimonas sp. C23AA TaxID=2719047 RepID=UPI0014227919|nr:hypothetical protein [Oleiagrimonas sp. C23AA]NII09422.1 hypothetical protein [Oleiagrimonas sp. C23AA]